jgi:hypothetical protein
MEYLIALLGLMGGAVVYLFVKKGSAEALLENNEVKSKLNDLDKDKSKNDGLLASEEEKRSDVKSNGDARKEKPVSSEDF